MKTSSLVPVFCSHFFVATLTTQRLTAANMQSPRLKFGYLTLAALNSFATTSYFFYLYFFTGKYFGFGKLQNLSLAALLGFLYVFASIIGGRFAQRRGYFLALKFGFSLMAAAICSGAFFNALVPHVVIGLMATFGVCFTWPTLEALVSEGEQGARLQRMVGIYNVTWAFTQALAYLVGGAIIERWGFRVIFIMPASIFALQFALTVWLERRAGGNHVPIVNRATVVVPMDETGRQRSPISPKKFLRMAWLANPFAYLAINTVVAVIPSLANRLDLSPKFAGFFCSVWFFVRAASFVWLWLWTGWHYRFRWLVTAYAGIVLSFAVMLLGPNLWVLIGAQVTFGLSLGLVYSSSLFYSMDVGETKGEHGGIHEAAIGMGACGGPAIGAAALYFFPTHPEGNTWAVTALLGVGLAGLIGLRFRDRAGAANDPSRRE